jgi:late competence protein required for DNA uptake (superfamily II DNA/RNA helicase)
VGKNYNVTVLEGVTGSGKTLVYFERIRDFLNKGFQSLIMLPEIALTNQFSERFKEFFGVDPAIWHSGTSKKNKAILVPNLIWCRLKFLTKNAIVMVICNRKYEFNDYIEKYSDFTKIENNK